ncbi:hypothetical protein [Alicyclobacillus shizuokensis]|uniref:hypothetical protein n=1 Tax=Alicyclobacillus shizuokensis TaxID=392014 RepID=UPI000A7989C2|nr:hypothetical protein [Alicyclobacillus shizuokensis]MCL6626217.1 hypothetical protein [Alicyclobacillus shizuokensis]
MAWVYYMKIFDTRFQADCLAARIRDAEGVLQKAPKYVAVFRTPSGKYGIKILW